MQGELVWIERAFILDLPAANRLTLPACVTDVTVVSRHREPMDGESFAENDEQTETKEKDQKESTLKPKKDTQTIQSSVVL
jgi:hypothetical protein